jgi:hypothetical protein
MQIRLVSFIITLAAHRANAFSRLLPPMSIRKFFSVQPKQDTGDEEKVAKKAKSDETATSVAAGLVKAEAQLALESVDGCSAEWTPFSELTGDWRDALMGETKKPYFVRLTAFLATEIRSKRIFPPANQLFTAFNLCQLNDLKVVIIGQDPYHAPGQAHGLAFSVQRGITSLYERMVASRPQ